MIPWCSFSILSVKSVCEILKISRQILFDFYSFIRV